MAEYYLFLAIYIPPKMGNKFFENIKKYPLWTAAAENNTRA